jgi:hypothetical protein
LLLRADTQVADEWIKLLVRLLCTADIPHTIEDAELTLPTRRSPDTRHHEDFRWIIAHGPNILLTPRRLPHNLSALMHFSSTWTKNIAPKKKK